MDDCHFAEKIACGKMLEDACFASIDDFGDDNLAFQDDIKSSLELAFVAKNGVFRHCFHGSGLDDADGFLLMQAWEGMQQGVNER
jgi:hypothetical protein